ncbi:hypothetical protein [Mucilaginibacter sp.]
MYTKQPYQSKIEPAASNGKRHRNTPELTGTTPEHTETHLNIQVHQATSPNT